MNPKLLQEEVQAFINNNLHSDIVSLLLKKSSFKGISSKELIEQIEAKSKSKKKLPTWFDTARIIYPNKLNISQTSSESTANYKSEIVKGEKLIDITAGFGVDTNAFSKKVNEVYHIEKNEVLSRIANHNFNILQVKNIQVISDDGIAYLNNTQETFDWIYVDPSRRTSENKKVFFFSDCLPDITQHLNLFFSKSSNILIKAGPMLDLNAGIHQLKNVKEIHLVAVHNDMKEILWVLQSGFKGIPVIKTINITREKREVFDFNLNEEKESDAEYTLPETFLYEPNAALMKSGAFNLTSKKFGIKKLHQHSHLYTSNTLKEFPGRRFKIKEVFPYTKKAIKTLKITKANVTVRNFPDSVSTIRKKMKLSDGGDIYLFFTTDLNGKLIVIKSIKIESKVILP